MKFLFLLQSNKNKQFFGSHRRSPLTQQLPAAKNRITTFFLCFHATKSGITGSRCTVGLKEVGLNSLKILEKCMPKKCSPYTIFTDTMSFRGNSFGRADNVSVKVNARAAFQSFYKSLKIVVYERFYGLNICRV